LLHQKKEDPMKLQKVLFVVCIALLLVSSASVAAAGDFDWMKDFNIRAEADPSGFRARLSARFNIGNAQVNAVLSNVERPADAYMVLRLGEMSTKPTDYVIRKYKSGKGKGWGALAQSLGIKPATIFTMAMIRAGANIRVMAGARAKAETGGEKEVL
jgi:hypothetical protein